MSKIDKANRLLYEAKMKFKSAEDNAREILKKILEPVGEHGVTITHLDTDCEDEFIAWAEPNPCDFHPVTLIRYWKGNLEVFLSERDERGNVKADGQWVDYDNAHVDTWFIMDEVEINLEWADGYDSES